MSKLIHLHLKTPYDGVVEKFKGKEDLFFSSYAALFSHMTDAKAVTGVSENYLRDSMRVPRYFENKRIVVRVDEVHHTNRKKQC